MLFALENLRLWYLHCCVDDNIFYRAAFLCSVTMRLFLGFDHEAEIFFFRFGLDCVCVCMCRYIYCEYDNHIKEFYLNTNIYNCKGKDG